ncbi:hypothetical protein CISIN_1g041126mg [Citrus sinensis]|uniref:Uncharacterized protein n=1 Tax=Citrus sinensis TaxID=2711 RepID=A0A067DDT5_CITSI|nr:hypothetical protein CISIN_1g041126mg [Citrus sinensis]
MDYDDEQTLRFLRLGDFSVVLIMQKCSPIMMITCTVGELQWSITKDAPVIRVDTRGFGFAMPGLLYGLQFSSSCQEAMMDTLETIFIKFADYKHLRRGEVGGYPWEDNEPNLWAKSRRKIEKIANKALSRFGQVPGKSLSAVGNQDSGLLKVLRTSAATKMVSNAILTGSLRSRHIDIQDMRPQDKCNNENVSAIYQQAFPSISVFNNLVEAVEIAWVISSGDSHLLKEKKIGELKVLVGFQIWRLNQEGIVAFVEKLISRPIACRID